MLIIKVFGSGEDRDKRIEAVLYRFFSRQFPKRDKSETKSIPITTSDSLHNTPDKKKETK